MTGRKKNRAEEERRSLINRLSRIEGQVRGVRRMVESDAYCVDILTQVSAIPSALNAFNKELLGSHIRNCGRRLKSGSDKWWKNWWGH